MTIQKQLMLEAKRLGFDDPDSALRSRWQDIPQWLQQELSKLGFEATRGDLRHESTEKGIVGRDTSRKLIREDLA